MTRVIGRLDLPTSDGVAVRGGTVSVQGWVLFDGWPADHVEVYVGDQPVQAARRAVARRDVRQAFGRLVPGAVAAGFTAHVVIPRDCPAGEVPVRVRAVGPDGAVWHSDPVTVSVGDGPATGKALPPLVAAGWRPTLERTPRTDGPLRVAVFTHSLNLGGGELYLDELLTRLRSTHGVELLVVSPGWGPLGTTLQEAGVPVVVTHGYAVHPHHYEGRVAELQALITGWGADVVLANTLGVFQPVDAGLRLGLPVVWAIHESFEIEEFIRLNWGNRGLADPVEARLRHCLAHAHTIFEAQSTLELLARQVPGLRGRHVHYGIDLPLIESYRATHRREDLRAERGLAEDDVVLLCMGVFQERKSQLGLVLAFAELADLHPRAKLVLVGSYRSPYSRTVEQTVRRLGLAERVQIVPVQPDIYPWYALADVLVSASDIESLPRSILEAKAFGLPTLATDVFGVAEVITDGVNGWLCRPASGNALVAGLRRAVTSSRAQRRAMAAACLDESRRYDGTGYARSYHDLMSTLAGTVLPAAEPHKERAHA